MKLEKRLEDIVTEELDLLGFELVKLESSLAGRKRVVRLFIDHPEREIGVDDCVRISKAVGFVLDGEDVMGVPAKPVENEKALQKIIWDLPQIVREFQHLKRRLSGVKQ